MNNKHMKNGNVDKKTTNKRNTNVKNNTKNNTRNKQVKNETKKKNNHILRKVLLIILAILLILAGIFTFKVAKNGGGVKGLLTTVVGSDNKKQLSEIRFLLMGESLNLTDTIMICSYNPNTQKANMVSVPRDTFIGSNINTSTASDKINAQYGGKSPEKTLAAVNKITGLNLQYYILVDTDALTELVDAIGGVDFYVPMDMNYEDTSEENYLLIHLKEGMQKIDGNKAEQLLRFRHNEDGTTYPASYGEQDIGRMRTQREFITATLKQTLKPSNILKLTEIIDIANKNIKTNLSISLIKDYIPYAVEFDTSNIETATLPGESIRPGAVWIYQLDQLKTQSIISTLFFDGTSEESINPAMPNIQILNGSGDASKLEEVVNEYKKQGYNILKVGNTSTTKKSTVLNRSNQSTEVSDKVKNIIHLDKVSSGKKLENIDFTVTIGKDYQY